MRPRILIGFAVVVLAALAVAAGLTLSERADRGSVRSGSTLEGRWIDADANGVLERGPGEPLLQRTELAPAAAGAAPGTVIARFAQITDAHVRDEESPARASLLDRYDPRLNSAFRPQEALSAQVLGSIVEAVNATDPEVVVVTGDLIDSAQRNELDLALDVLDGGRVDPDSGRSGYDGPQEASNPDPFFYRPDLDAPRHPGLLAAAQQPFRSPGVEAPWFAVTGNHDLLVQGEVPPTPALGRLAVGDRLLREVDPGYGLPPGADRFTPELVEATLRGGLPGRTEPVPADPGRRHMTQVELLRQLRSRSATEGGGRRLDYSFDIGPRVRAIALDLVDRDGGSGGRIAPGQADWLSDRIDGAGDRWVLVFSHQPIASSRGGERLLGILDESDRVVATIAGHTHRNSIEPRPSVAGGYWQIETAGLADFPQQARSFELVETAGGIALRTWMLDGAQDALADTARELAYLDSGGGRARGAAGEPGDRNAILYRRPG